MVLTSSKKGKEIKVNISAALRIYRKRFLIKDELQETIKKLQEEVNYGIKEEYGEEVKKVMEKARDMEENPSLYSRALLRRHVTGETWHLQVTKITVHEEIAPLKYVEDLDAAIEQLMKRTEIHIELVELFRKQMESLFDAEERIAVLFNEIGGL